MLVSLKSNVLGVTCDSTTLPSSIRRMLRIDLPLVVSIYL